MSIRLMAKVWTKGFTRRQLAVMLVLTDHANDKGESVRPSVDLVAWKTGYSKRTVQEILAELRDAEVIVIAREARQHRPREYRIDLSKAPDKTAFVSGRERAKDAGSNSRGANSASLENGSGVQVEAPGVQVSTSGVRGAAPDPSVDPSIDPSKDLSADADDTRNERQLLFETLADICDLTPPERDWSKLTRSARGMLNRAVKELLKVGADPPAVRAFRAWWDTNDWRGKDKRQAPAPDDVAKLWSKSLHGSAKNGSVQDTDPAEQKRQQRIADKINAGRAAKRKSRARTG